MRHLRLSASLATLLLAMPAMAQSAPPPPPAPAPAAAPGRPADPVVAKVNGQEVHLSDLQVIAQSMPEEARNMPANVLFPQLLDQAIDGRALVLMARKQNLDKDPAVQRAIAAATDRTLQSAVVSREVGPTVTEAAVRAKYDKEIAGKPGEEEVHARHILVATEEQAKKLIADLKGGADFATLAKANSTDPGAAQGGDLGFFKRGDMLPEFSTAAFALKPGEVAQVPVQTRYGWHVIKVEEKRSSTAPTYEEAREELRQQMIQEGVQKVLVAARVGLKVERFNADGSPIKATDGATPPPAPAAAPAKPATPAKK